MHAYIEIDYKHDEFGDSTGEIKYAERLPKERKTIGIVPIVEYPDFNTLKIAIVIHAFTMLEKTDGDTYIRAFYSGVVPDLPENKGTKSCHVVPHVCTDKGEFEICETVARFAAKVKAELNNMPSKPPTGGHNA